MILIFALGNPDIKYKNTPHNMGRDFVNWLVKKNNLNWKKKDKLQSFVAKDNKVVFAKSTLFMNQAGLSVSKLLRFYDINLNDLLIIQDELDLPWQKIKLSFNRSSAGHKGAQSIIDSLKSKSFYRLRIGVVPPQKPKNPDRFLLSQMPEEWIGGKEELFQKVEILLRKFLLGSSV